MTALAQELPVGAAYPLLFSPFQLGALTLPNRVVMAPRSSSLADAAGFVTPELIAFVRERALGGTVHAAHQAVRSLVAEAQSVQTQSGIFHAESI